MNSVARKRKVENDIEEPLKRLRVDDTIPSRQSRAHMNGLAEDEEDENQSRGGSDDFSEDEHYADTPLTPLSPPRKKFPSELKVINCTYEGCSKTFNRPARLTAHLRSHTNERPFVCLYDGCDKAYLQDKHLQHHIKGSHTKERDFRCDVEGCGKSFMTSTRLKRHGEVHKGQDRFRCTSYPPCNQSFRKHQTLQRHIRSDHLELAPYPCTYVDPTTDVLCNAGFDGANGLRQHVERVHDHYKQNLRDTARIICQECLLPGRFDMDGSPSHLEFTTNAKLQTHIRKEHAKCSFCDLKCPSHRDLLNHIDTQHSGKSIEDRRTYSCTYAACGKSFTRANNLKTHVRTEHLGERFICGTYNLSTHTNTPGFRQESGCGEELVSKASLVDHVRTAHLKLPSIINRNRKRTKKTETEDSSLDDDLVKLIKEEPGQRDRHGATVIDHLLGVSQAADPTRKIPCPHTGCHRMFIREYDVQVHLDAVDHNLQSQGSSNAEPTLIDTLTSSYHQVKDLTPSFDSNIDPALFETENSMAVAVQEQHQNDFDWELQQRVSDGGPFWVGGEMNEEDDRSDWDREVAEMRSLID